MGTLAPIRRQRGDMRGGSGDLPSRKILKILKIQIFEMQSGAIWVLKLIGKCQDSILTKEITEYLTKCNHKVMTSDTSCKHI